jgi:hypothetical protein
MVDGLSKMETAADNLYGSTGSMLRLACETKASMSGIVEGLRSGFSSAESTKLFAASLSAEIAGILDAFAILDESLEMAASIGERNLSRVGELDTSLAAMDKGISGLDQ